MIKETIKYTTFDGLDAESDLYFNISKVDLMHMSVDRLAEKLERMSKEKNVKEIFNQVEEILRMSYGERSEDGKYFKKGDEIFERFRSSAAYDEFVFTLISDSKRFTAFIQRLFPEEVLSAMAARLEAGAKEVI